ncbi:5-formyltetrahydrofolate cyclo-ligase [Crocinitomix sp.]|nr:5-formyltetrahydrofolate cyclo-ligase [Crocinitomix sp.]
MRIIEAKKELRKQMQSTRDSLKSNPKEKYDNWICDSLIKLVAEKGYQSVHVYLPMGSEININPFIQYALDNKITVIAPKTLARPNLENRKLTSLTALEKGVYGTVHPSNPEIYNGEIDLIVIPGLAIDKNNYRLGYGGGYYDTFLTQYPAAKKVGIYYPFQLVDKVPTEPHDMQLDLALINPVLSL